MHDLRHGIRPLVDTVQPLRQPSVNIEPHGSMRQGPQISFVEGHGMPFQTFKILAGEANGGGPQDPLPVVFWKPELEAGNYVGVDLL